MTNRALFATGAALGFPRLPIRPAVSVIAGREAWETFTTNGTAEDLAAARIAVAARLAEKAHRASQAGAVAEGAPEPRPESEKAHRTRRCAFCGGSLVGLRHHARYCAGRCRAAASRASRRRAAANGHDTDRRGGGEERAW